MSNSAEYDDDGGGGESLYRDVAWNTSDDEYDYPPDTPGCLLYNFIMYAVLGGSVCVLGCVGNIVAFVVFWRDKVKTSTSLLFQVRTPPAPRAAAAAAAAARLSVRLRSSQRCVSFRLRSVLSLLSDE